MSRPLPHVTLTRHVTAPSLRPLLQPYYLAHLSVAGEEVEHGFGYTTGDAIRSLTAALMRQGLRSRMCGKPITGWQL